VTEFNGKFELSDTGLNLFGLKSARKIEMEAGNNGFLIQQESLLDDGPFYQRFASRLMINLDGELHQAKGISEYICPERIYVKLFRPLVNMRIQYPGKTHWVQKSPRLYRWTW
jgi:carotenoid 1,2-hydratase